MMNMIMKHRLQQVDKITVIPPYFIERDASVVYFANHGYTSTSVELDEARRIAAILTKNYDSENSFIYDVLQLGRTSKIDTRITNGNETDSITSSYSFYKKEVQARPVFSTLLSLLTGGDIYISKDVIQDDKNQKVAKRFSPDSICNMSNIPNIIDKKWEGGKNDYFDVKFKKIGVLDAGTVVQDLPFGMGKAIIQRAAPATVLSGENKEYNCLGQFSTFLAVKSLSDGLLDVTDQLEKHQCNNENCQIKQVKQMLSQAGTTNYIGESDLVFVEHLNKETGYEIKEIRLHAKQVGEEIGVPDSYLIEDGVIVFENADTAKELYAPEYFAKNLVPIAKKVRMSISKDAKKPQKNDLDYIR